MLLTGHEYLESIRDGRRVYVGSERVDDVTTHPAFRNAARSFAMIYDRKRAPENREVMTFEEDGETFSSYFLLPRTREDLQKRFETHRRIASWTHGLLGRSPDNFPSYVSGLVMDPAMFDRIRPGFGDNIQNYYRHMRQQRHLRLAHRDQSAGLADGGPEERGQAHAADLARGGRGRPRRHHQRPENARHRDGVLPRDLVRQSAAGGARAGEGIDHLRGAAERAGVSIWSRKPYEKYAVSEFDNPLASRFDENDAAVLFENVQVPWERVFCHDNVEMTRAIYMRTPGHAMANHQANVRFLEKLKLIVGIASKVADMNGARGVPAVQFTLGRLAAMEATLEGLIMGQINAGEAHPNGYHTVNRRYVYAALHWCSNHYAEICDTVRELMGAGVFQMPADVSVLKDEKLRETFETYWSVPGQSAADRMKLLNLAWDLLGSDFAGRHMQYEKFYAGPGFVMNSYSYGPRALGRVGRIGGRAAGEHRDAGRDAEKIIRQSAML